MNNLSPRVPLLICALAAFLASCGPRKHAANPAAEDFAPYIKAYTGGIVTADTPIRIDLAEDAANMPEEGLFTFSPRVQGSVRWASCSSVTFTPEKLEAGTTYSVDFSLGKVLDNAPEKFSFGITVKGAPQTEPEKEEADNGETFRIKRATLQGDKIEVVFTAAPANAKVKGLVELEGAARSYVQVKDTLLTVHFENASKELKLTVNEALKDANGNSLKSTFTRTFSAEEEKPAVEIPLKGNILPDRENLILPFRAVNLGAVEVRVIKIYEKNILMFLQDNDLDGRSELRRSGRLVYHADIPLDRSKDLHKWNTHSIDLSGLFRQEPGAIYRIRLSFRQDQSLWGGKEYMSTPSDGKPTAADEATWDTPNSYYWDNDYNWNLYEWKDAEDPSTPSYYMESSRFPAVQLIASDLGLMAEYADDNRLWVAVTDLISAKPVSGASLEVFDFQLQSIAKGTTDGSGLAQLTTLRKPFAIVAKAGGSTAYLKTVNGSERSLSRFDVGGETVKQGVKAFIYGERGVWRPGDTLHVNAIVASKGRNLPEGHPATLEIYTPAGQFYSKLTRKGTDGIYSFNIPTRADDPSGFWNAYLKVGGSSFHKTLNVETVKPNRLKISTMYEFPGQAGNDGGKGNDGLTLQAGKTAKVTVSASWLTGSPAGGNKARAQITLKPAKGAQFKGFEKYTFTDPSSSFSKAEYELYSTTLDGTGNAALNVKLPAAEGAPGMLSASVMTSVQEDGGDESFTTMQVPYSPYSAYIGIKVPEGEFLETDRDQTISLAAVDCKGKRVSGHKVEYAVYKLQWNWWWESPGLGELDSYVNGGSSCRITSGTVISNAVGDATFTVRVNYPDWGKFLILARDMSSGHVSGRFVTIDWPDYMGRAERKDPEALTMLSFSTDKTSYKAGEKATVFIPAAPKGRALVSLENASGVISRQWVETSAQDTPYSFDVTADMAPNFYVHITLLQPYGNTANDLPIRLYGVQRVNVENPDSRLEPQIQAPAVIHPEETFTLKIKEAHGRPMTYTLAIVDEGLLDITAFKTPDPWSRMYRQEALGVKTWDMYDRVIGALGGKLSPIAAIGGDQDAVQSARKDNRFNPVVMCLPPRTLNKGTDAIQLKLPMYVGSVRIMVVAAHDGAYGSAEKAVPVQNPLMVVTTLPRILGTGEEVSVPVNVFAMEDGVKEATVTIKADGPASVTGPSTQKVSFHGKGDKLVRFGLKAIGEGVTHITVKAEGASHKASETIALTVVNPYPQVTEVKRFTLGTGESYTPASGASVQLAGFPALDARKLFLDMKNYPYSCSEQISARGITLLSLLPLLSEADAADARSLVPGLVSAIYARQNADGGFAYWAGGKSDGWVSSMAGHFLTLASREGFSVNAGVLAAWKSYQKKSREDQLDEVYRLYTLALASEAQLAPMNRLRESAKLSDRAKWMLASAYALSGKSSLADVLLDGAGRSFPESDLFFGSAYRDRMMALEALVLTGRVADAVSLAAESLPSGQLSTQETAFTSVAYRALQDKVPASGISYVEEGREFTNTTAGPLYGTELTVSRSARSAATSNGLKLEVRYVAEDGLNVGTLQQGARFKAVIKVTNTSVASDYASLALDYGIPSGWEILNERLSGAVSEEDGYDHLDIRDNRAVWFFGLPHGRSKTFTVGLRAAHSGSFVLPATVCRDMYHPSVTASTADGVAKVSR